MQRITCGLAIVATVCLLSGCAMCDSSLDYLYPASGGCYGWQADDCARAGSAFGGMGRTSYATSDGGMVITESQGQPTPVDDVDLDAGHTDSGNESAPEEDAVPLPPPDLSPQQELPADDDMPAFPPEEADTGDPVDLLVPPDFGSP